MKVNMRSNVAATLAALAFGAAIATAHEFHSTEIDVQTVECTDDAPPSSFAVETVYSTKVHQSIHYTLPSGFPFPTLPSGLPFPTDFIGDLTSLIGAHTSTKGQQVVSSTSVPVEEKPAVSSTSVEQPAVSTGEEQAVSTALPFTSTNVPSTFETVPASSGPVPAIVSTSTADAHSEVPTETVPASSGEQVFTTETIVPPVTITESPLINPLRPSGTPSDTPTTSSITLTITETLPGAPIPPVSERVSAVPSEASEAIIPIPPVTQSVAPVDSSFTTTTTTVTNSLTVTVIRSPIHTPLSSASVAEECFSTVYVTVYSPPSSPSSVPTAPVSPPALAHNTTIIATGVPRPITNNTTTNTTVTAPTSPPIHGAAPTISATPGILLAFCGLICYLI